MQYIVPKLYIESAYAADFGVFGGDMLCGFTLTDVLSPPKRDMFKGLAEFVLCQFELNLLNQALHSHWQSVYAAWRKYSLPFANTLLCFHGHGLANHLPYSILRFAQEPCARPSTAPLLFSWEMLGEYTSFFLGEYLVQFQARGDFSRDTFLQALVQDADCVACLKTPQGWESKHVAELSLCASPKTAC